MLKDRRVLLEQEIKKAQDEAANKYLYIVTHNADVHDPEYYSLKEKIMRLEFDLNMVNKLINKGHE